MELSATVITTHSLSVRHYLRPATLLRTLWVHRELIRQLTWRNVLGRYRGSSLGIAWSFILPLMMLAIYTFVFGVVFRSRWPGTRNDSMLDFALGLYAGLLVYTLFAETLNLAPSVIANNPNYVKKVVFPLEILPLCSFGAALIHFLIGIGTLLICAAVFAHNLSVTLYWFPLILLPLAMLTMGLAWFLASLGVYVRDIGHFIGIVMQMLMFMSPIFYSLEQLEKGGAPRSFRIVLQLNPLTTLVQGARDTLLWGRPPRWLPLLLVLAASAVTMQLGYAWFMKTRRGFADVL